MNKIAKAKNSPKNSKNDSKNKEKISYQMLFLIIISSAILGFFVWNYFIEKQQVLEDQIPQSNNINYKTLEPIAINANDFIQEFESNNGKPILVYLYTTWCATCKKDLPKINEIIRNFQNTELHVMILAIDNNITVDAVKEHFSKEEHLYFPPKYLSYREGLISFLATKNIHYRSRIPFTALVAADGKVVTQFSGVKSERYLTNKIIKTLGY